MGYSAAGDRYVIQNVKAQQHHRKYRLMRFYFSGDTSGFYP